MTAIGPSVRSARLLAMLRRTARSCATCTVWVSVWIEKMRYVVPFARTLEKPSTARCGRCACDALRNMRTPSGDHTCTTRSSLPVMGVSTLLSSAFVSGTRERSDSAICCMW